MKKVKFYVKQNDKSFEVSISFNRDVQKEIILRDKDKLISKVRTQYQKAELIELLIPITPKISKNKLLEVGNEIASSWGGSCTAVKTYENIVIFECIEHGEKFAEVLTYDEIKNEYSGII